MYLFITTINQEEQQSLDESLVLPPIASEILECFLSSDEEEGNSSFSAEAAIEEYKDWYNQQQNTIKMIAVMAMDIFIRRFGLTQVNAAKEASLFIGHNYNEKTIW